MGFRILERRFKTKSGEIDIIASKGSTLVFIEVKARKNKGDNEVLTTSQQKRISDAAKYYISRMYNKNFFDYRFDLIIFHSVLSFKHIKNAWEAFA